MIATFERRLARQPLSISILALCLGTGFAAQAQTAGSSPSPTAMPPAQQQPQPGGNWNNERFERQEFREEMENIRKEHEELEAARDKLLDQCVNATGAQAANCDKQKQALHEWHDRLHERVRVLREKMDAERKEHPPGMMGGMGMNGQGMGMGGGGMMMGGNAPWPHANDAPPNGGPSAPSAPPQ